MTDDRSGKDWGPTEPHEYSAYDGAPRRAINPRSPRQSIQPESAPPPPPRSRHARNPFIIVLNFFVMVAVLGAIVLGAGIYLGNKQFEEAGPLAQPRSVLINQGANLDTIASVLASNDVISNPTVFSFGTRFYDAAGDLKAGEYLFQPGVSMRSVMETLVQGRSILHAVTIPEGWTSHQIVARLSEDGILTGPITAIPPEGTLMPDTYKYTRGATRQEILDQMSQAHARVVEEVWQRRVDGLPIESKEEFITLASIVEKETGKADERPLVASVFINRLNRGMRLQSDPTIIYGIFGGQGKPSDRPIYRSDINKPTAYNTYTIDGLPPGPIANPGRAALEAVANPSRTENLFFVADGTGGHAFAKTLDEHNRNVARWRQVEAARAAAARAEREAAEQAASESEAASEGGAEGETPSQ